MKKIIFSTVIALTSLAFMACSNGDVEIQRSIVININASSVTAPFKVQAQLGDLQSPADGCEIRSRLLVYDTNGNLVNEAVGDADGSKTTQFLANYESSMRVTDLFIPDGDYTMIAITDVVLRQHNNIQNETWTMSGQSRLSTLRLDYQKKDNTKGLVYTNAILGIGKRKVHLPQNGEIAIQPEPAGCLFYLSYKNVRKYVDAYDRYGMMTDWVPGFVTFNENGDFSLAADRPENKATGEFGVIHQFDVDDNSVNNSAQYYFTFPSEKGTNQLRFFYRDKSTGRAKVKAPVEVALVVGGEYMVETDLGSSPDIEQVNTSVTKVN